MSKLPTLPKAPKGVQLGLKCPQSVLYMDLGLRGCLTSAFRRIYGVDHAYNYIVYDSSEKSFDLDNHEFHRRLSPELKADVVAQKYLTTSMRNARKLIRTAQIVSSPARWRSSHLRQDLMEDLNAYWDAYEDHTNTMYVFWGLERFTVNSLIDELSKEGFQAEVDNGLPSFIVASEPNWFALEQQNLEVLKSRFTSDDETSLAAAAAHASTFGDWYTPYNLGVPPSSKDVMESMRKPPASVKHDMPSLEEFPEHIKRLGELVRQLAFWKSERTDTLSIADRYASPMYKALSDLLGIPVNLLYFMTRNELTQAITCDSEIPVSIATLKQRSVQYCIGLIDGSISFYQPSGDFAKKEVEAAKNGDILQGMATSPGVVQGRVRLLSIDDENPILASDEIIVMSMTRPELGAALDVALAYITDEGGRLCHAAIVSREKKKPCVTGLGNATKVLRPGMIIEVDGTKGKVTVVNDSF
jgi:phosphohistidine swiveling domain-containing protein